MAQQKFTNNAKSKLAGSLNTIATSLSVTATEGPLFPALGAGDWHMATLIKTVGGLPVREVVKVTARTNDTLTIVRAQESTTAVTFSAGDVIELRPTAGTQDNMAQRGGDNTYTGSNDFTGVTTLATVAGADNSNKAVYSGWVRSYAAAKGANNDITSLSGLTTALSVAQGGTGATTGPQACINLGAVQQGTGVGQGSNVVKLGWATAGGGLKGTIDTTDMGFLPFSSTNPNGGGVITFANPVTAQAAIFTTITASGLLAANAGLSVTGTATTLNGGAAVTLGNTGYLQIGSTGGLNIVFDYANMQARNNGAAATLNLNNLGGLVQVGTGGLSSAGSLASTTTTTSNGRIYARNAGDDKMSLYSGATAQGHIGADNTTCFKVANAAFSQYVLALDNAGNLVATGNITANSDESLKENWRELSGDFLDHLADMTLLGLYDRVDIAATQIGMSAQQVQAFAPQLVQAHPETGILSLDYGKLGAVSAALLCRRQRQEIAELKTAISRLMDKVGDA